MFKDIVFIGYMGNARTYLLTDSSFQETVSYSIKENPHSEYYSGHIDYSSL